MWNVLRNNWLSTAMAVLLVVAPLNLFWQIPLGSAYVSGLRLDYLIPKLYVSWLIVLVVTALSLIAGRISITKTTIQTLVKNNWLAISFGAIVLARQFLTVRPETAIIHFFWLITAVFLVWSLSSIGKARTSLAFGSGVSICIQLLIGWWQLIQQRSLTAYHWLGETNLSNWFGIAKGEWFGREIVLPYGTSAHPNILANTLVILWWFTWLEVQHLLNKPAKSMTTNMLLLAWIIGTVLSIGLIVSTQSLTGILSAGLAALLALTANRGMMVKKGMVQIISWTSIAGVALLPILMLVAQQFDLSFTHQLSWTRRVALFNHTVTTLRQHPVWGTGLTQSTIYLSGAGGTSEVVRFVQPVHNLFWLVVVEMGAVSILGLLFAIRQQLAKLPQAVPIQSFAWVLLVPAAALDHFWFTQWPGILLTALLFASSKLSIKE